MKPYITTALLAGLVVGGAFIYSSNSGEVTYLKPQISATSTEPVVEEEAKIPEEWAKEAQKAYDNVIRQNELAVMEAEMVAEIRAEQAAHAESIAAQKAAHEASIAEKQAALDEVRREQDSY